MENTRELGNDREEKTSGSSGSAEASVKLKSSRDVKKPPRGSTFFDRYYLVLEIIFVFIPDCHSKGSQTTNLIQEPVTRRDSRPPLFKFNELMLVCWVFMDNVMP
ncbi:hypothetical protein AAG906_018826 [Vitis piasezkii]